MCFAQLNSGGGGGRGGGGGGDGGGEGVYCIECQTIILVALEFGTPWTSAANTKQKADWYHLISK